MRTDLSYEITRTDVGCTGQRNIKWRVCINIMKRKFKAAIWGIFLINFVVFLGCSRGNAPTPTVTKTPIPTNTPTPSPYPTSTPIPTMLPEEVTEYVRELLLTNNGCRLPCFLGITLGETTWKEVEKIFLPIAYKIAPPAPGMDPASAYVTLHVDKSLYPKEFIELRFLMQGGVVVEIQGGIGLVQSYNLSEFLMTFGKPSEIHLGTWVSRRYISDFPFSFSLYYPDLGIIADYWATTNVSEDLVIGCPTDELPPYLMFWEPEEERLFLDLVLYDHPAMEEKYLPHLEDATGMSIEEFYEIFIDPESEACFEVPLELFED